MKNVSIFLVGAVVGVFFIKSTYEYANIRVMKNYNECVKTKNIDAWRVCNSKLKYNTVESLILWQPNLWCKYNSFGGNCKEDELE